MPHLCPPLHVPITRGDALALFLKKRKPFFYSGAPGLNCIMWGLVPQPGIKLRSPPGAQSLSHWTIRKVPLVLNELSISSEPWHRLFPQPWTPLPTSPFLLPNSYSSSETQMKCSGEAFSNTPPAPRHHPASLLVLIGFPALPVYLVPGRAPGRQELGHCLTFKRCSRNSG